MDTCVVLGTWRWPGIQGAPRYSPCYPAMASEKPEGEMCLETRLEPSVGWGRERCPPWETEQGFPEEGLRLSLKEGLGRWPDGHSQQ